MPGPVVDPDAVARAIVDATVIGDAAAAEKHGVSVRTIGKYRATLRENPEGELAELVQVKRKALSERWLRSTADARDKLLAKVLTLVDVADVDQLRDVVGALKIVHDANVSERVIADGLGGEGPGAPGADQAASPFAGAAHAISRKLDA